ncbi:MAG: phosphonate C-P lyase system protein PhnG [Rhizobiales bacterium]|nr:phosphonate C-P lyase system protein PhnG [Hyphomicrobiales bacterium]
MDDIKLRRTWLSVLARSNLAAIEARLLDQTLPDVQMLRPSEVGLVMVRGRAGGNGRRFNLGEMPVTRCSVRSAAGHVGHGYVQGRDKAHAELAARLDAALQDPGQQDRLMKTVIQPLAMALAEEQQAIQAKAAATRVDFFTMVRGESE